jgi:hypothetical protein
LSNNKLKNIYDEYYLDYNINFIQTHQFKPNINKQKLYLIDKVYSNLFDNVLILNEKADINNLNYMFYNEKQKYIIEESDTTQ